MKTILLALLLSMSGCLAQTENDPPTPDPAHCAWTDATYACDPSLFTRELEPLDAGDTYCTIYVYHCGDYVDACKREVYDCQPQGDARVGRP